MSYFSVGLHLMYNLFGSRLFDNIFVVSQFLFLSHGMMTTHNKCSARFFMDTIYLHLDNNVATSMCWKHFPLLLYIYPTVITCSLACVSSIYVAHSPSCPVHLHSIYTTRAIPLISLYFIELFKWHLLICCFFLWFTLFLHHF